MRTRRTDGRLERSPRKSRGVAAVEFAIIAPLILLLLLATAEIGRALVQYQRLSYAVRNSARYVSKNAIVGSTGVLEIPAGVVTNARNLAVYGNAQGTGGAVLPNFLTERVIITDAGEQNIRVAATYDYESMLGGWIPTFGLGDGDVPADFEMQVAVTMRAIS